MAGRDDIDGRYDDPGTYDGRYPPDWDARRRTVYRRDDFTCQQCGRRSGPHVESGVPLHAHHVDHLARGGSNDLSNLVTLCERCHEDAHEHDFLDPVDEEVAAGVSTDPTDPTDPTDAITNDGTAAGSFNDPTLHYLIGTFWVAMVLGLALLVAVVVLPVGFVLGLGMELQAALVCLGVPLLGVRLYDDEADSLGPSGFPFVVPGLLLAAPLWLVLEGIRLDWSTAPLAVFGSVSLASRTSWYVDDRTGAGHLVGPLMVALASVGLLGNLFGEVRAALALPWVGGLSLAVLGTPAGFMLLTLILAIVVIVGVAVAPQLD